MYLMKIRRSINLDRMFQEMKLQKIRKYMTCVNCSGNDPFTSMMNLKDVFHDTSNIIAYHAIQSFKPHETNADTVHEIGVETATRLYGDRYQFVVCTHLDKDHLHNHIVLNPVSIVDGKRYHNSMKDIYQLREVSDEICKEYGLSIVEKPQGGRTIQKSVLFG